MERIASLSRKQMVLIMIMVFVIIISSLFIVNFTNSGYLEVSIKDTNEFDLVLEGKDGVIINFEDYSNNSSVKVSSGTYTVKVYSDNSSFISSVNIPRFYKKSSISGLLSAPNGIDFIANNPDDCITRPNDKIYSMPCRDFYSSVSEHIKPGSSTPPYKLDLETYENWLQIIDYKGKSYGLIKELDIGYSLVGFPESNGFYRSLDFANNTNSDNTENYNSEELGIAKYKDGLLVYSKSDQNAFYLESLSADPLKIDFNKLDNDDDIYFNVTIFGDYISYYQEASNEESLGSSSKVISVYNGSDSFLVNINDGLARPYLCDTDKVCGNSEDGFKVLKITNGDTTEPLYELIGSVENIPINNRVYIISEDIISYNPSDNSGYIAYNNKLSHPYCGFYNIDNYLGFCVQFDNNIQNVLAVLNPSSINGINELNSLVNLSNIQYVYSVTLNSNSIWVTTDIPLLRDLETGYFDPNPELLDKTTKDINTTLEQSQVNTNLYKIKIL